MAQLKSTVITGDLTVTNDQTVDGNQTINGDHAVLGQTTLGGDTIIDGNLQTKKITFPDGSYLNAGFKRTKSAYYSVSLPYYSAGDEKRGELAVHLNVFCMGDIWFISGYTYDKMLDDSYLPIYPTQFIPTDSYVSTNLTGRIMSMQANAFWTGDSLSGTYLYPPGVRIATQVWEQSLSASHGDVVTDLGTAPYGVAFTMMVYITTEKK